MTEKEAAEGAEGVARLLKSRDPTWQVGKNRHLSCFFSPC